MYSYGAHLKTFQIEMMTVATILTIVAFFTHGGWLEWIGALAVLAALQQLRAKGRVIRREDYDE